MRARKKDESSPAECARARRDTVTVDYGPNGAAELDALAAELRKHLGPVIGNKAITRSFVARFAVRILRESIKANQLLKLMRLASEGAGKAYPPPSAT